MSLQYIKTVKFITDGVKNQFLNSIFSPLRQRDFLQFSISTPPRQIQGGDEASCDESGASGDVLQAEIQHLLSSNLQVAAKSRSCQGSRSCHV